jgi:hypothetical protein
MQGTGAPLDAAPGMCPASCRGFSPAQLMSAAIPALIEPPITWLLKLLHVDDLKAINDQHGHAAGDRALIEVARACKASLRESDLWHVTAVKSLQPCCRPLTWRGRCRWPNACAPPWQPPSS